MHRAGASSRPVDQLAAHGVRVRRRPWQGAEWRGMARATIAPSSARGAAPGVAGRGVGLDVDQLPNVVVDGVSAGLVPFWPYKLRV